MKLHWMHFVVCMRMSVCGFGVVTFDLNEDWARIQECRDCDRLKWKLVRKSFEMLDALFLFPFNTINVCANTILIISMIGCNCSLYLWATTFYIYFKCKLLHFDSMKRWRAAGCFAPLTQIRLCVLYFLWPQCASFIYLHLKFINVFRVYFALVVVCRCLNSTLLCFDWKKIN